MSSTSVGSLGFTNPAKSKLIKRLMIKFTSRFGSKEGDIKEITDTIKRHLEGKEHISPEIFDSIETELQQKLRGGQINPIREI